MQAVEKARLASQQAAAAAAPATPAAAVAGAAVAATVTAAVAAGNGGLHTEGSTPEDSCTSSVDGSEAAYSSSNSSNSYAESVHSYSNGHQVAPGSVAIGELHSAVILSGGATYSPSGAVGDDSTHGGSGVAADPNGGNGATIIRERSKVKLQ